MAVLGLRRRSWTPVILIITGGAGALFMVIAGKQLIGRSRPPLTEAVPPFEYSAAFPSGHALGSVVIAGIVAYLVVLRQESSRTRLGTMLIAAFFAVTIGLSRVYLGHHWLTDVLAGAGHHRAPAIPHGPSAQPVMSSYQPSRATEAHQTGSPARCQIIH
jgi:undecaprenyl-diphosphatase